MLIRREFVLGAAAALATPASAQPALSAEEALRAERAAAAAEGKGVLLEFYASWCAWCTPMDALLQSDVFTRVVSPRFRTYRMRVLERRGGMRAQQLAGADDVFHQFADAASAGLPFLVLMDAQGRTLIDSVSTATNANVGFPVTREELEWFDVMVRTAAPEATREERLAILRLCARLAG